MDIQKGSSKTDFFSARVFVLLPDEAEQAVVLRRGPAKRVGIFQWNIRTDEIFLAQWLKGRIYEYFSDVSSDGSYFIYSAQQRGVGYTAISNSPWLKAITLWENVGGRGGGVFINKNQYLLYDRCEGYCRFRSKRLAPAKTSLNILKDGVYPYRLRRRGWEIKLRDESVIIFHKSLSDGVFLEKIWQRQAMRCGYKDGHGEFYEDHHLIFGSSPKKLADYEWCEWRDPYLLWAEGGCLFRAELESKSIVKKTLVYDFNPERFEERVAPY